MAFLTIAGITYEVLTRGADEQRRVTVGSRKRAFAGNLRSTIKAVKREWRLTVGPLTQSGLSQLRSLVAGSTVQAIGGDLVQGVSTNCIVQITGHDFVNETQITAGLSIREV